jgi:tetratricopeptide (TPR) repeat protein
MKRGAVLIIALGLGVSLVGALAAQPQPPPGDAITQGLWWLYQPQYDEAREKFEQYNIEHSSDPTGYFFKTAVDWWQLAQQYDEYLPDIQKRLDQDYQDTVRIAKQLYDSSQDPKVRGRACLYWGGAEGLMGRWLVNERAWISAYFAGRRGNKLLKKALEYDPTLSDAYLGLGIYDYFTDTLPGVVGILADLFIHGDRERGLKELQIAIDKGRHARVEAMFFLIQIDTWEENKPGDALALAKQLRREFPSSPAMYVAELTTLYRLQQWDALRAQGQQFLEFCQDGVPYYPRAGIRVANYCLGLAALNGKHNPDACLRHMNDILAQGIDSSRWVSFAYLRMGQAYDVKGDRPKAVECYQKVLDREDYWGAHREARRYLKTPFYFPSEVGSKGGS